MTTQQAVDEVRRMIVEWPSSIDTVAVKAITGMLCDRALELGFPRSVSVVLVVFCDVTILGLRDLYVEKRIKAKKDAVLKEINARRGDLTPSQMRP
jgi:hypothetical protein